MPTKPIAFDWYAPQPGVILLSLLLGLFSGWLFRFGSLPVAWLLFIFAFVWVLIMGLALAMWLAWRVRPGRGQWRVALHLGFSSVFPPTTTYLLGVLLMTLSMPLTIVTLADGKRVLSRPDYIPTYAMLYACAAIVGAFIVPLYVQGTPPRPVRPPQGTLSAAASPAGPVGVSTTKGLTTDKKESDLNEPDMAQSLTPPSLYGDYASVPQTGGRVGEVTSDEAAQ